MTHTYSNMRNHKGTHLSYEERVQIETLKNLGFSNRAIARELGRAPQTINNEIHRGTTRQIKRQKQQHKVYEYETQIYFSSLGQQRYRQNRQQCGAQPLWKKNPLFIPWADHLMKKKRWLPEAVVAYAHKEQYFEREKIPSTTTVYAWIDQQIMETKNIDLLEKLKRRHSTQNSYHNHPHSRVLGPSIETRPSEIESRQSFGHWEIDTVIGTKDKSKPVILTLVERQTRFEILEIIESKSADAVSHALKNLFDSLGEKAPKIFKSITSDNGSEFASLYEEFGHMIEIYFTHPFSSYERGTSENQHKMIRRFIPKAHDLSNVQKRFIKAIQQYMNDYPRKTLNYNTAHHNMAESLKHLNLYESFQS
ncbi:IS30 family transposase [Mammaliicoccus sciuri]|uniref:IS30 family transposase n=1 Tax=Mammaliicoccus sciuri TaxID=1296 RepID=UPI003DA77CA3